MSGTAQQQEQKPSIRGVLFDLDGTLLDTEGVYADAAQAVIDEWSPVGGVYGWDVRRKVVGAPELVGAAAIVDAFQLPMSPEEYLRRRNEHVWAGFRQCQPTRGAVALVEHLVRDHALPIAVATSSWKEFYEAKTSHHPWLLSSVRAVVTGEDPRVVHGKPAPDIFLAAAADIGVPAAECLIVEDAVNGVKAAVAAGAARVVAVPVPELRDEVAAVSPDVVILDSLEQFSDSLLA